MAKDNNKKGPIRKILRVILGIVIALLALFVIFVVVVTIFEYRPDDVEVIELTGTSSKTLAQGDSLTVLTWNTGYGALGESADFFMDGGTMVYSADKAGVMNNLEAIADEIDKVNPDVVFLLYLCFT